MDMSTKKQKFSRPPTLSLAGSSAFIPDMLLTGLLAPMLAHNAEIIEVNETVVVQIALAAGPDIL